MNNKTRITELDSLRGIAALAVVFFHYTTNYRDKFSLDFSKIYDFEYGHYGVQLFFIISGFVIYMSLSKVKSVGEFVFKRFLRLFPTYWFSLSLTLLALFMFPIPNYQYSVKEILLNYTMFQGVIKIRNVDGSYWSLLPELFFYILMAFVIRFKFLTKINYVVFIWLGLILLSSIKPSFLDVFLNLRFGMFFIAGIMFYQIKFHKDTFVEHFVIALSLISVYVVRKDLEYFLFATLIFSLFYLFVYGKLNFLNQKVLLFLGFISYPLYLIHQAFGYVIIYNLKNNGVNEIVAILLALFSSIFIAWIIAKYVENFLIGKIKKLREKIISNNSAS
jgi:peptidoglycan/LPS O-acetylase OafA/YrhL